jgi:hypothetical protein
MFAGTVTSTLVWVRLLMDRRHCAFTRGPRRIKVRKAASYGIATDSER